VAPISGKLAANARPAGTLAKNQTVSGMTATKVMAFSLANIPSRRLNAAATECQRLPVSKYFRV
ncbi:MAG: hypothetical protein IT259_03700, partial [Saprospiraceae bacterium]|nr:hypothetical protein [Saprospiraceae bacterium]